MKKQILTIGAAMLFIVGSVIFIGCGNSESHAEGEEHAEEGGEHHENTAAFEGEKVKDLSLILDSYFQLKNALVKDDAKAAAKASEKLLSAFNGFDMAAVTEDKMQEYMEITEDAVENAEHISENADKIDHQREHLVNLSEDINDLIVLIGSDRKLYQDFCPMANDGNGATWISETEEIQNPYMGSKMPTCGKIQQEL
ncbi:MAG: DUF3347 domain-containing protein [Vicingaceae bacterium]|nr:DUF3347 domain-containing protein [Vicingaceae bacterium]